MTLHANLVKACLALGFTILLLAGCTSTTRRPESAALGGVTDVALTQPSFQNCELRAFIAWGAARNAILFHETESQLLASPNVGAFQVELYSDIFDRIKHQGMQDYNGFAAEQLLDCTQRAGIPMPKNKQQVAACLARLEIVMFSRARMLSGMSERDANTVAKVELPSRALYSDALIDELTPRVYRAKSADDFYDLRRSVFESCILP